jgi:hypothetical protein
MAKVKTATWLRWVHFIAGIAVSQYIFLMPEDGWSSGVNSAMKGIVAFVFWTGVIRWQLPRYRRWKASRATATA